MTNLLNFLLLLLISFFYSCSPVQTSGTISDVDIEIAMFHGIVVDSSDATIDGVVITLYDASESDTSAIDTVVSNISGAYSFDSIVSGSYHIVANYDDTLSASLWNLSVDSIIDSVVLVDTLRLSNTGTIVGSVENYDGYGLVTVYIPGTSYMASVDANGDFIMSWIAPDTSYTIAFERYGYAPIQMMGISVELNDTTFLSPVSLTPNEYPRNLMFKYDTLQNVVTLNWDRMDRPDIDGYMIYRQDSLYSAMGMDQVNTEIIKETEFKDTLDPVLYSRMDSIVFKYQIRGITKVFGDETGKSRPVYVNTHIERDEADSQSLELLTPTNGELLKGLTSYDITWNYTGLIDSVRLYFSVDGGESWNSISGTMKNRGEFHWTSVYNFSSTECQIRVENIAHPSKPYMSDLFEIEKSPTDNLIKNGDFSEGVAHWHLNVFTDHGVEGSFDIEDGTLHGTVIKRGKNDWDMGFVQGPFHFQKNYIYEVNFRAKASKNLRFETSLHVMYTGGYLGGNHGVLTTEWQNFTVPLTMIDTVDEKNGGLNFVFSSDVGEVWFDDISMKVKEE